MVSIERLTEWVEDGEDKYAVPRMDLRKNGHQNCCNKLAEYEDLEEQGLLLRLPVAVGDTVYYPEKDFDFVYPVRISQIIVSDLGNKKQCRQYNGCFFDCNGDLEMEFEFDDEDFGKTVFLTQFEAEEKLEALNGENILEETLD